MRERSLTAKEVPKQEPPSDAHLSLEEGRALVQLARRAIKSYLQTSEISKVPASVSQKLLRKSGVFVTLNSIKPKHELRGCIGFPYPSEPLANATLKAAIYAAVDDPRFPPVSHDELEESIVVEVTVLTPPSDLRVKDRRTLPDLIEVGRHGLIIDGRGTSGLLLPQVAMEWEWDASEFLTNCCLKAGLPPDSWLLPDVEVKTFEGEIFEELTPAGEVRRKASGDA